MKITFYHSRFCPRCHVAGKFLREIIGEDPSMSISEIEITSQPIKIWRQGIHMIPALQIEQETLSGIYLSKKKIKNFIRRSQSTRQKKA